MKGDERILGSSEFVLEVLKAAREAWEQSHAFRIAGVDLAATQEHVSKLFEMAPEELRLPGKHPKRVAARSVLCYLLVRQLGMTTTAVAKELGISQPAVSIAATRGETIVRQRGFNLPEQRIL
jgi:chromosomal replication initiation ATPase DnaA